MMNRDDALTADLLKALIRVTGRVAIPPAQLREMIIPDAGKMKQLRAYNLCDGSRTQGEVQKAAGIDAGSFSHTLKRWLERGIVFRIGDEKNLLHLYPMAEKEDK